ncbi:unnamed protein product [Arctogadus glacialis]
MPWLRTKASMRRLRRRRGSEVALLRDASRMLNARRGERHGDRETEDRKIHWSPMIFIKRRGAGGGAT